MFCRINKETHHNWAKRVEELQSYIWPIVKQARQIKKPNQIPENGPTHLGIQLQAQEASQQRRTRSN
jgi:hypothetical protein